MNRFLETKPPWTPKATILAGIIYSLQTLTRMARPFYTAKTTVSGWLRQYSRNAKVPGRNSSDSDVMQIIYKHMKHF